MRRQNAQTETRTQKWCTEHAYERTLANFCERMTNRERVAQHVTCISFIGLTRGFSGSTCLVQLASRRMEPAFANTLISSRVSQVSSSSVGFSTAKSVGERWSERGWKLQVASFKPAQVPAQLQSERKVRSERAAIGNERGSKRVGCEPSF